LNARRSINPEEQPRGRFRVLGGEAAEAAANVDPAILAAIRAEGTMLRERDPIEVGAVRRLAIRTLYRRYASAGSAAPPSPPETGRPLRVLRVVSNLTQGGVAKVCVQSVLAMDPAAVETTLLVFEEKKRHVLAFAESMGVNVLPQLLRLGPGSTSLKFYRDIFRLSGIIRSLRPDLIHLHEPQFAPIVKIAAGHAASRGVRAPLIVHLHNDYRARTRSLPVRMMPLFLRALRDSALIACSKTIRDAAADWLGTGGLDLSLIEDGADDRPSRQNDIGMSDALKEAAGDRLVLACMANLAPHKRVQDFIQACRVLLDEGAPIFCLLMGYGKLSVGDRTRAYFWERIAPREGEVLLRVGQPYPLFPRIDIGISPSSLEGLGLNLLEFQIHGIPVVCTDLKPHREMVAHEVSGLMYPVGDVEALVDCLRRLIQDAGLRRRLGDGGRLAASRRKWSDTAAATTRLYRRIINGAA
jgi:glycosyltransferase involved in cell wall biosynthesis